MPLVLSLAPELQKILGYQTSSPLGRDGGGGGSLQTHAARAHVRSVSAGPADLSVESLWVEVERELQLGNLQFICPFREFPILFPPTCESSRHGELREQRVTRQVAPHTMRREPACFWTLLCSEDCRTPLCSHAAGLLAFPFLLTGLCGNVIRHLFFSLPPNIWVTQYLINQ